MRFGERASLAWSILTGRNRKTVATLLETWKEGKPTYSEVSFVNMVKEGWRRNELIFACISKTANTAAQVGLQVTNQAGKALPNHPLKKLIQRPNPYMSEFDFWAAVIIYQKLAGRAVFEKVRSRAGQVVELWPLRPDYLSPIPSSKKMIAAYEYEPPGVGKITLAPEDVLDFKLFDPLNQYNPWPPVAVAARVGDVDNAATDYIKLFFEKGGVPPGLLKTVQKLQDANVADIRRRWRERYGGYAHWLEPAVLDMDAEYQKIGYSFDEMGFDVLDARNEARICQVLDTPPIIVGAKIGLDRSTYSNYKEARLAWWEDTLLALYASFLDVAQNQIVPDFGENALVDWDFSRVKAFQDQTNAAWQRAKEALLAGGITVNEYRELIGKENIGPAGDVFLRGNTLQFVSLEGEVLNQPITTGVETLSSGDEEDEDDSEDTEQPGGKSTKAVAPDDDQRRTWERKIEKAMTGYFDAQIGRIRETVG
jgi:HK97 family phage portal protein